ncbi:indolepyruvate ferredoxin oxidoreductase family protein [Nocardia sp. NPDC060259]|uniref:indolepyruvate ferredoxin oxidoreductase family protein n=1 Tax=Nocardia sp. NPDC060259 TaxID=3347088 RepID=UPI00364E1C3C
MLHLENARDISAPIDLSSRYRARSGPAVITGTQAIVRQLVEQHERDRRVGQKVATFVSGYPGSPLAGLDRLLAGMPELAGEHDVHLVPAVNEELAATSVWGSQLELPSGSRNRDGVVGVWYGKGPGLDRAGDAMRHAALYGAHPTGGVLVLVGDDPAAKSSSVPATSERALAALGMPVFFPRNAEEIVGFGLYGVALSRASGCPSSMKIVADVADGLWTLDRDFTEFDITTPQIEWQGSPWTYRQRICAAPPDSLLAEADLHGPRWAMVEAFNAANDIDCVEVDPSDAWLGIVAVGTAYDSVREALGDLGFDADDLDRAGVRILRVGMPYPLGPDKVRRLARGVRTVMVVEEKTAFVELQVLRGLYSRAETPEVIGKQDINGRSLIPADGQLTAERLLEPLRRILAPRLEVRKPRPAPIQLTVLPTSRAAAFCSGCPHNRSTVVPEGSLAGGGIGCHTLVTMSARPESQVVSMTQMGGEGAQWIGQAPFTDVGHIFQNIGDGTYFHSGQLAVQACIAAGVDITYKILYNSAVAMTGAQHAEAAVGVPALTRKLAAEGVARIIVCSDDPGRFATDRLAAGAVVWHRDRLDEAQRLLRDIKGVTVLIYDQECAAEARRQRKRGLSPQRRTRVLINESVCEGCGDCGVKSNCLSVHPVDTDFGRKTRIDQSSCNADYTCLDGDCPSFVTVELPERPAKHLVPVPPSSPAPQLPLVEGEFNLFLAGIGGTGIVTVNQVLGVAAQSAGFLVSGLDQIGLSQKAGPVTSHLRLGAGNTLSTNRINPGAADCLLAFDLLTAAEARNAAYADSGRTVTVSSTSATPTSEMIRDTSVAYPSTAELLERLGSSSLRAFGIDALDAAMALLGATEPANFLLVGAAYQFGAIPIPEQAIEAAIEANGVAVEVNRAAFRWGRAAVSCPEVFGEAVAARVPMPARSVPPIPHHLLGSIFIEGSVRALVENHAAELVAFHNEKAAVRYLSAMQQVWSVERKLGGRTEFSESAARGLFKLSAYKDEYEVARLLTDTAFLRAVHTEFPDSTGLTYRLHPPVLRSMGMTKKLGFRPRSHVALRLLARGKALRGTPFDPFGYAKMRRLERALLAQYEQMIREVTDRLSPDTYPAAVAAAQAATIVRGYDAVKLRSVDRYRRALRDLNIETPTLERYLPQRTAADEGL